jgi:hypothetical protein
MFSHSLRPFATFRFGYQVLGFDQLVGVIASYRSEKYDNCDDVLQAIDVAYEIVWFSLWSYRIIVFLAQSSLLKNFYSPVV